MVILHFDSSYLEQEEGGVSVPRALWIIQSLNQRRIEPLCTAYLSTQSSLIGSLRQDTTSSLFLMRSYEMLETGKGDFQRLNIPRGLQFTNMAER